MVYKYTAVIFIDAEDQEEAHLKLAAAFEAAADLNNNTIPHLLADSRVSIKRVHITNAAASKLVSTGLIARCFLLCARTI